MEFKELIKTRQFLEEITNFINTAILKNFPSITCEEKEDIGQEVKLKILKIISSGKKITNFKSYLRKMVYTTSIDILKERVNNNINSELDEASILNPRFQFFFLSPELLFEKQELRLLMEKMIDSLPQNRRIVLKLYLAGMELEEIADILHWSPYKVRHLFSRATRALKKKLEVEARSLAFRNLAFEESRD